MDIFAMTLDGFVGDKINGITEGVWVERYRSGGDFTFTFSNPEVLANLTIDTLLTHSDTEEIMIVENIEVTEEVDKESIFTVTGRSLSTVMMQNRRVTVNIPDPDPEGDDVSLAIGGNYLYGVVAIPGKGYRVEDLDGDWKLAKEIMTAYLVNTVDHEYERVDNLEIISLYTDLVTASFEQDYNFSSLPTVLEVVEELLSTQDLGIRTSRPSNLHSKIQFIIYKGRGDKDNGTPADDAKSFSWFNGNIKSAKYLLSSKTDINGLYIYDGDKVAKLFDDPPEFTGLTTRIGTLDVSSLELDWGDEPWDEGTVQANATKMYKKARPYIDKAIPLEIADVDVKFDSSLIFNTDYFMGDLFKVYGNYQTSTLLRIVEHVRYFDKTGEGDYPVLEYPTH